jgi:hypothetical protein
MQSPPAKVAESDKFRCSDVAFWQAMSLRLEPKFIFIVSAEDSEDFWLRFVLYVGKRRIDIFRRRRCGTWHIGVNDAAILGSAFIYGR